MTNTELIAEAHMLAGELWAGPLDHIRAKLHQLADALEASEAQATRLRAIVAGAGTPEEMNSASVLFARIDACNIPYPADLLKAIETWDNLLYMEYSDFLPEDGKKARATLVRYGLVEGEAK